MGASASVYMGVAASVFGGRKRDAAESLIMDMGNERGFGNGFLSGAQLNFRSVINIIAPIILGRIYTRGSKANFPGLVFLVGILSIVLAEISLRSISDDELGLDKRGQRIKTHKKTE